MDTSSGDLDDNQGFPSFEGISSCFLLKLWDRKWRETSPMRHMWQKKENAKKEVLKHTMMDKNSQVDRNKVTKYAGEIMLFKYPRHIQSTGLTQMTNGLPE